jgi:hypothetical protein
MGGRGTLEQVLRALTNAAAELSEEDLERVFSGRYKIKLSIVKIDGDQRTEADTSTMTEVSTPTEVPTLPTSPKATREEPEEPWIDRVPIHKGTSAKQSKRGQGPKQGRKLDVKQPSPEEFDIWAKTLNDCKTRDEARHLLSRDPRLGVRENLAQLAKLLSVYVAKHDDWGAIEHKIIEFTVGSKLRTDAIQGLNLKRTATSGAS